MKMRINISYLNFSSKFKVAVPIITYLEGGFKRVFRDIRNI